MAQAMDSGRAMKLLHEAFSRDGVGDLEGARDLAERALEAFGEDRTGAAAAHHLLSLILTRSGEPELALAHVDAAVPLRGSTGDQEGTLALHQQRFELLVALARPAEEQASMVVEAAERNGNREELARALHQLALQRGPRGGADVERALNYCDRAGEERARSALLLLRAQLEEGSVRVGTLQLAVTVAREARSRLAVAQALLAIAPYAVDPELPLMEALDAGELLRDDGVRIQALLALADLETGRKRLDRLTYAARLADGDQERELLFQASQHAASFGAHHRAVDLARDLLAVAADAGQQAAAWFVLAQRLLAARELTAAANAFEDSARVQPHGPAKASALGMAGQVWAALDHPEQARVALSTAVSVADESQREALEALLAQL
jgi:hypothetical protein